MDFNVEYYKKQIKFRDEILKATKRLEELLPQQSEQIEKEKESLQSYKSLYKEDLGEAIGLEDVVLT